METVTDTQRQNTEVLASDILLAILVNLKRFSGKQQLFLKADYNKFQEIFWQLGGFLSPVNTGIEDYRKIIKIFFIFSDGPLASTNPVLQEAIEQLQLAGMICWPDTQEPGVMRLNPSAENWYEKVLTDDGKRKLPFQDNIAIQQVAREISEIYPELVVDRPHLMNC